jgi:hypothetical protein
MIKRVCHVTMYRMKKMVDCVEDLVGDAVSKIRGQSDHEYNPVIAYPVHMISDVSLSQYCS